MVDSAERPPPSPEPAWEASVIWACSALVLALGLLALYGWWAPLPWLAALSTSAVPMAPSTAVLLSVHGLLLTLRAHGAPGRRAMTASVVALGVTGAVTLVLLFLSVRGIQSDLEHPGLTLTDEVNGTPIGHISPVTAGCLLLVSLSALSSLRGPSLSSRRRLVALASAALVVMIAVVFLLAYSYGQPLLTGEGRIPPALNTTIALVGLGVGLLVAAGPPRPDSGEARMRAHAPGRAVLVVFLCLSAGMVAAGYFYQRGYERHYRAEVESLLLTVAEWKVSELSHWRRERIGDGAVLLNNQRFAELVEHHRENSDPERSRELKTWLTKVQESYHYDRVYLVDVDGRVLASSPDSEEPVAPGVLLAVRGALERRELSVLDLDRESPQGAIYLSVLVPISSPPPKEHPLGVLVLRVNAERELFPMIQQWPTLSRTAETLLVRKDGADVVFLNELRFLKGTALALRESLENPRLPAAQAALGREGLFVGVDYRGHPVISALKSIPDSPWALVARMDEAELYGPLSERLWLTVVLVVTLLLGSGASLGLVWRQQSLRFYRKQYEAAEALRASEAQLKERNDELVRFTYSVSHDLKSPLVTIQTFVGYLEQDLSRRDEAAVEKDFGFIRGAAHKMSLLLDELLELSRVGRSKNPAEDVTLQAVVEEALTMVRGRVAARGVQVDTTAEPIVLHGDRIRLVEVFQNLIDNAVKFMGNQPNPRVEIGVAETSGQELELFVRDNGVGIDPRHIGKLFGLFEKLDPKSEGTGIGLALVKRIVEAHGGHIRVESGGPGSGSLFRFTLAGTRRAH